MNFSKLKGIAIITSKISIKPSVQVHNQMFSPMKTKHWQLRRKKWKLQVHLRDKNIPCPAMNTVPFSLLLQKVVSVVTRILPSKWWVNTQTERAARPAWHRSQKLLLKKCSQWRERERGSESEILGGRPPPHLHLPSVLALWHQQHLPYQLLSLLSCCFPQTPAKQGPNYINS